MITTTLRINLALPGQDPVTNAVRHQAAVAMAERADAGGLTAVSLGWAWWNDVNAIRVEYFNFTATEDNSFVDIGSDSSGMPGEFDDPFFLGTEDDIGDEVDVIYNRTINEYFGFEAGVAVFMPGDACVGPSGPGDCDDVTRVWGQARLRF